MSVAIAVVDDVASEARQLADMVRRSPSVESPDVVELLSSEQLYDYAATERQLDVLFVDVCLGQDSGIELVGRLQARGRVAQVVYVSGFDEAHTRVYQTPHASFVRKPLRQEDVDLALAQALARREAASPAPLMLRHDHVVDVVRPQDVLYVESDRRHVIIHTRTETHRVYGKLSELLASLPASFVRCHQSYAINLDFVDRLSAEFVTLTSGECIPVSRRWRASVREALFARVREG